MSTAQHIENFLQLLTAGLLTGAIYGLMCVGLSIIFGVMRVINFAQGEFLMLGMYFAYYCFGMIGGYIIFGDLIAPFIAALAAGPAVFLIGVLVHKGLVSQVTGVRGSTLEAEGHHAQLILTLGISLILANGGLIVFGSAPVSISTPLSSTPWIVGPLYGEDILLFVNQAQTIAALIAVAVVVSFAALMANSRLGRALRAAADNPVAAVYMGIDVDRAYRIAFGFGVGITAVGGGLLASTNPFQPYVGIDYVVVMYAGVVLGGLGSLRGAFYGGLTIGLVQQLSALFLPNQLQNTAIFVCFLLIVLYRPDGLFGRAARRA
ncbi:branched-chain amino acid ABC transporter permease [Candidatus Rariloculus sp.]|uniref:branched-chain amino acid ABC transporter permease n=1 Tax=Candidatus Rariloculus sp. TaxID=3101265 RepID=UPI003D09B1BE